jgi:hypothetical protein
MDASSFLMTLLEYQKSFEEIISRFIRTSDGIHINKEDDQPYRRKVIELIDVLNDNLGSNSYSTMIANHFNEGISNFYESPSYASVQRIISVVGAVVTRVSRNPELVGFKTEESKKDHTEGMTVESPILEPDKLPLSWFFRKLSWRGWITLIGLVLGLTGGIFIAGIHTGQISFVREFLGEHVEHREVNGSIKDAGSAKEIEIQIKELTQAHNARVSQLQAAILEHEKNAARLTFRKEALEAAKNLRTDLARENEGYKAAVDALKALRNR